MYVITPVPALTAVMNVAVDVDMYYLQRTSRPAKVRTFVFNVILIRHLLISLYKIITLNAIISSMVALSVLLLAAPRKVVSFNIRTV